MLEGQKFDPVPKGLAYSRSVVGGDEYDIGPRPHADSSMVVEAYCISL